VVEAVRALRFQLETLRHGVAPVRRHLAVLTQRTEAGLARLHAQVWAPLAPALAGARRVLVIPHAQLGALPFAALTEGAGRVGEQHLLAVAPSARLAIRGLDRPGNLPQCALAFGESTRLPEAGREAAFVAGLFDGGRACIGESATVQALREQAGAADVLHLACHAQFRDDNPSFSALHLHDGALTVELVEGLRLRPCTVVLSACETGLSEVGSGDEMVGLVRAFFVAGAARVLASLWPVDDAVTLDFMAHFYAGLRAGLAPSAALQATQAELRREHPHPYFWAAFTLYGGW
jgi:CHAT domain-containing protein